MTKIPHKLENDQNTPETLNNYQNTLRTLKMINIPLEPKKTDQNTLRT